MCDGMGEFGGKFRIVGVRVVRVVVQVVRIVGGGEIVRGEGGGLMEGEEEGRQEVVDGQVGGSGGKLIKRGGGIGNCRRGSGLG